MAGATFGRKGVAGEAVAASPRATFGANLRATVSASDPSDPFAAQREAFIAAERARRGESESDQTTPAPTMPSLETVSAARRLLPKRVDDFSGKSFPVAFLLWLLFGVGGAHRFYLARPVTGALQAGLFLISTTLAVLQYYAAFAGVMICLMWMTADAALISRVAKAKREAVVAD